MIRATRRFQLFPCWRALLAAATLFAGTVGTASATIIGTVVDNGDGTHTYSYEVDNSAGAFDVAVWSLEFAFAAPDWDQLDTFSGGDVSVPNADWFADAGIPVAGLSAQDFVSLDPAGDVLIGNTLAGFSFTSAYQPGLVDWAEFAATGASASGRTIGPVVHAVPAPGSGLLWVGAGALMILLAPRRRSPVSIAT